MIISYFQFIWQNNNRFEKGTTSATLFWSRRGHECPTSPGTCLSRTEPCAWIPLLKSLVWWTPRHAPREVCPRLSFTAQEWPTVTRVHSAHCRAQEQTRHALSPPFPEQENCILDPLLFTAPVQSVHVDSTMGLHWSTVNQIFLNLQYHETCRVYTTKENFVVSNAVESSMFYGTMSIHKIGTAGRTGIRTFAAPRKLTLR